MLLLGRYRIIEEVGRGSFASVARAIDETTGQRVAIKAQHAGVQPLWAEYQLLRRLRHPSLPVVLDVGRSDVRWAQVAVGTPFFVAQWVEGIAIAKLGPMAAEPLIEVLLTVLRDIAGALSVMHGAGLLHHDVAPDNVLWDETRHRATLIDLGCADGFAGSLDALTSARGTPEYMAPEALIGMAEPRSDLYGLGACAIAIATGHSPFAAAARQSPARLLQAILKDGVVEALPMLPTPLAGLLLRLTARAVEHRPRSALATLEELDYVVTALPGQRGSLRMETGPAPAPPLPLIGRRELVGELTARLSAPGLTLLIGGPASGGAAVVDAAVAAEVFRQLGDGAAAPLRYSGTLEEIAHRLDPGDAVRVGSLHGLLATCRAEPSPSRSGARSAIVTLDAIGDERAIALVHALRRPGLRAAVVVLIDDDTATALKLDPDSGSRSDRESGAEPAQVASAVLVHRLQPLSDDLLRELATALLGVCPSHAWIREVARISAGEPVLAAELILSSASRADARGVTAVHASTGADDVAVNLAELSGSSLTEAWSRRLRTAPAAVVQLVVACAIWDGCAATDVVFATIDDDATDLRDVASGQALGLLRRSRRGVGSDIGSGLAIDRALAIAALDTLDDEERARWSRRAIAVATAKGLPELSMISHWLRLPVDEVGAAALLAIAQRTLSAGLVTRAAAILERLTHFSARRAVAVAAGELELLRARIALARGDYPDALEAVQSNPEPEARLLVAKVLQRRGEFTRARAELTEMVLAAPDHEEAAGTLARVLLSLGELDQAKQIAHAHPLGADGGACTEVLGLCAFYRGQLDDADRWFAIVEHAATRAARPVALGRAWSMRGMVAQQRGQLALASERYDHAAEILGGAGEVHSAAVADLNLGTVLAERGRHGDALAHVVAAGRVFRALEADADWVAAEVNRGNSLVALGERESALAVVASALRHPAATPHLCAFAQLVEAEIMRRDGDLAAAARRCAEVIEDARARSDAHALISGYIGLVEAGAGPGSDTVATFATSEDDRQRIALACARRSLLTAAPAQELRAAAAAVTQVAQRAQANDRMERAFRASSIAARLAFAVGDASAPQQLSFACALHDALIAAAPAGCGVAMRADPDRMALSVLTAEHARSGPRDSSTLPMIPAEALSGTVEDATSTGRQEPAIVRRLLSLSRRLNSDIAFDRLLDEVIDTAIELTQAERGFLLLRQPDDELVPMVARNFSSEFSALGTGAEQVSRSIAEQAARSGEPVITIDAGLDTRFDTAVSVAALRLRSVMAVPLRQRGIAIGCIYVDHRLRRGAFDENAAAVLGELADIAAIAIGNARLTAELRRNNDEIARLNRELASELAERDAELVRVRAARSARTVHHERQHLLHRHERIAGTSQPMVQMLALVDRAASTSLPVVIVGESGTGKELVARALHDHSARRDGPFVAVNCSALPDTLLESELFGHVRGAFTGADRERRGMFEVAHQGTLFLDEIADTSPAMQARLLRVLQDGVVRRIGDAHTTQVNVRVVAATQRALADLVAAGRFRDDLRYRLEVLAIPVPPLRDRPGDLPILIEHLLRDLCPDRIPPRLSRAAMRALLQHRWPGNVRELANVLAHGVAMTPIPADAGAQVEILDVIDLPPAFSAAPARTVPQLPDGEDLRLRPALRATEQAYLRAAMRRTAGNQTAAAKLLGLSRFGLQKKLQRRATDSGSEQEDSG
jgi:transcriptional regulator with GAF, ATPase, and Fis domain/tetratricopeptide (TPR) repeat protein